MLSKATMSSQVGHTPIAKASRKMTRERAVMIGLVTLYCFAISGSPGAIMELPRGATNVYSDTC